MAPFAFEVSCGLRELGGGAQGNAAGSSGCERYPAICAKALTLLAFRSASRATHKST
jgi:hypothetical protein